MEIILDIVAFLGKFAVCMLVNILAQAIFLMGLTFQFQNYNIVAWIAQVCTVLICAWIASLDWDG